MYLMKPWFSIQYDGLGVPEIYQKIERAGRVCYKSEDKITPGSAVEFVRKIIKNGHESVLEHHNISVLFGCDRGVSHELVRHRLCAFSQESTRYCDYGKKGMTFIIPPWTTFEAGEYDDSYCSWEHQKTEAEQVWYAAMRDAMVRYQVLLDEGWSPQQARSVLPNSLKTEIIVTANLREWRHILKLRTSPAAHPQMRELMVPLLTCFVEAMPEIFGGVL